MECKINKDRKCPFLQERIHNRPCPSFCRKEERLEKRARKRYRKENRFVTEKANEYFTESLRHNDGSQLSIWWRWFKCEGWIVVLPPLAVALIFLAIKVAASLAAR